MPTLPGICMLDSWYRGGQYWKNFTYMTGEHFDYPLLIPASVARSWEFIGRETQLIPIVIGLLFTFATIGIVGISISRLRGERQGLLAGRKSVGYSISHCSWSVPVCGCTP